MARDTGRDRAWNRALELLLFHGEVTIREVAESADVSERTAGDVLRTMSSMGYGWAEKRGGNGPIAAKWVRGDRLPATLSTEQA